MYQKRKVQQYSFGSSLKVAIISYLHSEYITKNKNKINFDVFIF